MSVGQELILAVGYLASWLLGLVAVFYIPLLVVRFIPDRLQTLGAVIGTFWLACGFAGIYVAATIVYLAIT